MKRRRQRSKNPRSSTRPPSVSVARLATVVRQLRRRVARLEGRRKRIGFKPGRDDLDTEVVGEMIEQDEGEEDGS